MNLCVFTGNLVADPDQRFAASGKAVASFKIAVNEGKDKPAEFIQCVAFDRTAELISTYCQKGSKVGIQARYNTNKWTDKEGNDRYTVQMMVDRIEFLGSKPQQESGEQHEPPNTGEDCPF